MMPPQPNLPVRVKIITGSLVTLENLVPENYRYRYRLEIRMNYHYRYRLGARSHPFISIDSQLPSRKSFELISSKGPEGVGLAQGVLAAPLARLDRIGRSSSQHNDACAFVWLA